MKSTFIKAILVFIMVFPWLLYADTCTVASGQTMAFTLAAGAKASWNSTMAGVRQRTPQLRNGASFSVYQLSNGIVTFKTPGFGNDIPLKISLFSVDGRKIGAVEMNGRTSGEFNKRLMAGIYFARFQVNGVILKTSLFVAGR